MEIENKRIGVYGIGISGISTVKKLSELGCKITLIDSKSKEDLKKVLEDLEGLYEKEIFEEFDSNNLDLDLIIKSPGIPSNTDVISWAREKNIPVISDLELGYELTSSERLIVITGTNGKTTTTSLINKIIKDQEKKVYMAGNIGIGIMDVALESKKDDILLVEASSFQLENTIRLKPKIACLINISPDHIDWHGNYLNYQNAKKKVFINQNIDDWAILNYDQNIVKNISEDINSKVVYFSSKVKLDKGIYLDGNQIVVRDFSGEVYRFDKSGINIIDENLLAAVAIAYSLSLDFEKVEQSIRNFKPLEHRMEFVCKLNGISFYNDSKGTNPESTIKALESIKGSKILIAGGYDKGACFKELSKSIKRDVKELILFGDTKEKIKEAVMMEGFNNIYECNDMKDAVNTAYSLGKKDDNIILSPACASWGMYDNFQDRGEHFKKCVENIKVI